MHRYHSLFESIAPATHNDHLTRFDSITVDRIPIAEFPVVSTQPGYFIYGPLELRMSHSSIDRHWTLILPRP